MKLITRLKRKNLLLHYSIVRPLYETAFRKEKYFNKNKIKLKIEEISRGVKKKEMK